MTNYNWNYPTTMWVGENRAKDLHLACNNLNIKNIPLFLKEKFQNRLKVVNSRFSIRSSTSNRLPYFGSLEKENEYFIGGMGSWGFIYAPFFPRAETKGSCCVCLLLRPSCLSRGGAVAVPSRCRRRAVV